MTSTSCFGVKKQKLNSSGSGSTANGGPPHQNGYGAASSNNHCNNSGLSCLSASSVVSPTNGGLKHSHHHGRRGREEDDELMDHSEANGVDDGGAPGLNGKTKVVNRDMVVFCFDALHSFLKGDDLPKAPKFSNEQFPLFVTWKVGKDKKLRGCIGTFNCTSLHNGLREYAITSACKDSRFEPITSDEVNKLHCSVSLLMDFEMAAHYLDWEIGIHGIRIEFCTEKGSKKAATYLPEVAVEQGWNHMQTIDSLLRKGGFKGQISPDIRASVCVIRFQSDKLSISYQEYLAHKRDGTHPSSSASGEHTSNGYATANGCAGGSSGGAKGAGGKSSSSRLFVNIGGTHRYQTRSNDSRSPSVGRHPPSPSSSKLSISQQ